MNVSVDIVLRGTNVAKTETIEGIAHSPEAWTDDDGRVKPFFLVETVLSAGTYRLVFDTEAYFAAYDIESFYPQVCVSFKIGDSPQHYHVPLLLSPYGFSTYRGS